MTKEEATIWRREQRRKRNRESAAASRQRQRDRISELEGEVEDWKVKYQAALDRLEALEKQGVGSSTSTSASSSVTSVNPEMVTSATAGHLDASVTVSPCPYPKHPQEVNVNMTNVSSVSVSDTSTNTIPDPSPSEVLSEVFPLGAAAVDQGATMPLPLSPDLSLKLETESDPTRTTRLEPKTGHVLELEQPQLKEKEKHLKENHLQAK